jgi:hypothetical protein
VIGALVALSLWVTVAMAPAAPMQLESARVTTPASVTFQVTDAYVQTTASGGAVTVSFNQGTFLLGRVLRISVKADGDLTAAGGAPLLASGVSWTTSNVASGVGSNGSLSTAVYTQVYQSDVGKKTGRVDLTFRLAAPGASARAVTYVSTLRWKFEAVWP